MVWWHHRLDGHGFGWTPGVGDGQGGLSCCGSWARKELDTTEWLNWTELNLPWFLDLTFQVPMQYCSLQHWTWLPLPVTSTTGHCFHFGSVSSFFLELFLHSSPVAYWVLTNLGSLYFSVISFCLFMLFMGFSRQEYWSGLPFPSAVDNVLSELSSMTHPSWVAYRAWLLVSLS